VKEIHVERGSFARRFHARAKGRGTRVLRHSCHIYITVGD
jgi:large subunit ribosomal protein L22